MLIIFRQDYKAAIYLRIIEEEDGDFSFPVRNLRVTAFPISGC